MTTTSDAQLQSMLASLWRIEPASLAVKLSDGRWRRALHLDYLSQRIASLASKPLRLLVSIPPRHGKSHLLSLWTPVWFLSHWSEKQVLLASYEATFAASWGRLARNVIEQHQVQLGLRLASDSAAVAAWSLTAGGGMVTAGAGGPITGRGADLLLVDDPVKNIEEARSPIAREALWDWWCNVARPRLEPGGSIIIIMARWHRDDIIGRLLREQQEWDYVALPAIAGSGDPLGRGEGKPLWPERYDLEALAKVRDDVGEDVWLRLYQQTPEEAEGDCYFDVVRLTEMRREAREGEVFRPYVVGRRYAAAIDPAGEGANRHSLTIMDCQTGEHVVAYASRESPDEFGLRAYKTLQMYECPLLQIEPNGVGLAMIGIFKGLGYPVHRFVYADAEQAAKAGRQPERVGMPSTGGRREMILADYAISIHGGSTLLYSKQEIDEHLNFIKRPKGKPEAAPGAHDDMVMSGAWANWCAKQVPTGSLVAGRSIRYATV